MEGNFMAILLPIFVFSTAPRDVVVSCLLAKLAQSSQTVGHSQIITMNSDAVFVVCVCGHGAFYNHCSRSNRFFIYIASSSDSCRVYYKAKLTIFIYQISLSNNALFPTPLRHTSRSVIITSMHSLRTFILG